MGLVTEEEKKIYLSIIKGTFRQSITEEAFNSILDAGGQKNMLKRDWEMKDKKTGETTTGTKFEFKFVEWTGFIRNIKIEQKKFGEVMEIIADDIILNINTKSRFFGSFMNVLPNIDMQKEVTLHPYDFEDKKGKKVAMIKVTQGGEKVISYYYNAVDKVSCHGIPVAEKGDHDSDYWDVFFAQQRIFFKGQLDGLKEQWEAEAIERGEEPKKEFATPSTSPENGEITEGEVAVDGEDSNVEEIGNAEIFGEDDQKKTEKSGLKEPVGNAKVKKGTPKDENTPPF